MELVLSIFNLKIHAQEFKGCKASESDLKKTLDYKCDMGIKVLEIVNI